MAEHAATKESRVRVAVQLVSVLKTRFILCGSGQRLLSTIVDVYFTGYEPEQPRYLS